MATAYGTVGGTTSGPVRENQSAPNLPGGYTYDPRTGQYGPPPTPNTYNYAADEQQKQALAAKDADDARVRARTVQSQSDSRFSQEQAFAAQKQAAMTGLLSAGAGGGASAGGGAGAGGISTGAGSAQIPGYNPAATLAAEDAAFGRAKDKIAGIAQSRKTGIADQFAARGLSGSGLEMDKENAADTQTQGQLGDFARQQAISSLDAANQQAQLGLTARGQDIGLQQSAQQRQLDLLRTLMSSNLY